jgi:hypothetical protein
MTNNVIPRTEMSLGRDASSVILVVILLNEEDTTLKLVEVSAVVSFEIGGIYVIVVVLDTGTSLIVNI